MRTVDNGFVKFMCKLDGKKPPRKPVYKWDVTTLRNVNVRAIHSVLEGDVSYLFHSFTWDSSPQGFSYWEDRNDGEVEMTGEDYEFLREVLRYYS